MPSRLRRRLRRQIHWPYCTWPHGQYGPPPHGQYGPYGPPPAPWWGERLTKEEEMEDLKEHIEMIKEELKAAEEDLKDLEKS
ncbi:MAG: DUF5320 domain-containing protein [Proteobacteria bacterium]|nr:DUF5320 domain-containing protein [Pseudomonadota bacterium]